MSRIRYWFKRLRYRIDHWFSSGPAGPVLGLGALSLLLVLLATAALYYSGLAPEGEPGYNLLEAFWTSLVRAIGGGGIGLRGTPWGYRLIMFGITLGSIFVVSLLIGTLTNTISGRIAELRKGRAEVMERDHIVILGWTPQIFAILTELVAANASQKSACVVILAQQDKMMMEDRLRQKLGKTGRTRIVCRTGNPLEPDDLKIANLNRSRAVIVLSPESDNPDADVIKTVLAITNLPRAAGPTERRAEPYRIVAAIRDHKNLAVARVAGREEVVWIDAGFTVARIIAQTSNQAGLSLVYSELLNYRGNEIYFHADPALEGKTFAQVLSMPARQAVIGLQTAAGRAMLNPPMDTILCPGDQVILIAQDDHLFTLNGGAPDPVFDDTAEPVALPAATALPEKTILLGWNWRASIILEQLDYYARPGSETLVVADSPAAPVALDALAPCLHNLTVAYRRADITDRSALEQLDLGSCQHVILLCYSDSLPAHQADAGALVTLLHLRDIADKANYRFTLTSEMMDDRNRKLAMVTRADDFIVSERVLSLMMAQVAENHRLNGVFEELFDPTGSEIYLKPAESYVPTGKPARFAEVVAAARRRGEVAFGYRQAGLARDKGRFYGVVINPDKNAEVTLNENDRVIVLARE